MTMFRWIDPCAFVLDICLCLCDVCVVLSSVRTVRTGFAPEGGIAIRYVGLI